MLEEFFRNGDGKVKCIDIDYRNKSAIITFEERPGNSLSYCNTEKLYVFTNSVLCANDYFNHHTNYHCNANKYSTLY